MVGGGRGLGDESVVCGIVNGRDQDAVELDEAGGLVQFVLHAGDEGNLDDGVELLRQFAAGSYVVPGMDHEVRPAFCESYGAGKIVNGVGSARDGAPDSRRTKVCATRSAGFGGRGRLPAATCSAS